MPSENRFEVEVEIVANFQPTLRHIVVRPVHLPVSNFTLTDGTTLGGIPVEGLEAPPRAHHPDGSLRLDLLSFRLRHHSDCSHFQPGQKVFLEGIQLRS